MFSLRVGNTYAEVVQKEFGNEFAAQQFLDLERFQVLSRILEKGTNTQPFKGVTLQPVDNSHGRPVAHGENSRRSYCVTLLHVQIRVKRFASNGYRFGRNGFRELLKKINA